MTNALSPSIAQNALAAEEQQAFTALLTRQAALYAPGSSSLPAETVAELARGIEYTVALGRETARGLPVQEAFTAGRAAIQKELRRARLLLAAVEKGRLPIENLAYQHTITALPGFFKAYDMHFFPHDVPCDIDYPTALPIESWQGVTSFTLYLRRLAMENSICAPFAPPLHRCLLQAHWPLWQDVLVNITEPLILSATGLCLLGLPPYGLSLSPSQTRQLEALLTAPNAAQALREAGATLAATLALGPASAAYLPAVLAALCPQLLHCAGGKGLAAFFPPAAVPAPHGPLPFTDGPQLPAATLRALIEEMRTCRHLSDKLAMLQKDLTSLQDFADCLEICFSKEEAPAAFALLGPEQLAFLLHLHFTGGAAGHPLWGISLQHYLLTLPPTIQAHIHHFTTVFQHFDSSS